jgi:uncharacterized RDD family membrane protein YckC
VSSHGTGDQSAKERLALAREAVDAGSGKEALKALEQAFKTSKKEGETESLREISELAEKLRANSSESVAREAAQLAYAASQNVRLLERRARISADSPSAISGRPDKAAYAGWGSRFGAWLLDWIILFIPTVVLGVVLRLATGTFDEEGQGPELLVGLATVPLAPLYFAFFHAGARGQTLGKRVTRIAVKDERTLERLSLGRSLGRAYLTAVLWWVLPIGGILDALWPLWDSKNQALHDKAVTSMVVDADR